MTCSARTSGRCSAGCRCSWAGGRSRPRRPSAQIDGGDVMETTASLVDKSLVRRTSRRDLAEFTMLESLREFAAERLAEHGEADATRDRHARYFAGLGAWAEAAIGTAEVTASLHRIGVDQANLRAALTHALATGRNDWALPLASARRLELLHPRAARRRAGGLDRALRRADGRPWCRARPAPPDRGAASDDALAGALLVAGIVAFGRWRARPCRRASRRGPADQYRQAARGDSQRVPRHIARSRGEHGPPSPITSGPRALHGELGNDSGVAWSRYDLGLLACRRGDLDSAAAYLRGASTGSGSSTTAGRAASQRGRSPTVELKQGRPMRRRRFSPRRWMASRPWATSAESPSAWRRGRPRRRPARLRDRRPPARRGRCTS